MRQESGNDADVGYVDANGRVRCTRINRTGAWMWKILEAYYSDTETLERLISMGDCFYFARNIGPTTWPTGDSPGPNDCKFYRRDNQRNHYDNSSECSIRDFFARSGTYKFLFVDEVWYTLCGEFFLVPLRSTFFVPRVLSDVMDTCRDFANPDGDNDDEEVDVTPVDSYSGEEFSSDSLFTSR